MKKPQRVLIATDLGDHSDSALIQGKLHLQERDSEITLLHVADISGVWDWPALLDKFQNELKLGIEQRLKEQMNRCGVHFKTQVLFGDRYYDLHDYVKNNSFDLLVMGHRPERPLFSGSLAKKIIASTDIPVLIANNHQPISKIACLMDLSHLSSEAVQVAQDLSTRLKAQLHYYTVVPDIASQALMTMPFAVTNYAFSDEEKKNISLKAKESIKKEIPHAKVENIHVSVSQLDISSSLCNELEKDKVDLAILAKHNRGPLEKLFIGSVSKGVIDQFKGSVLILPT